MQELDAIGKFKDGWTVSTWLRELPPERTLAPKTRRALADKIADAADDQKVVLRADVLRTLLAAADRPKELGARIEGTGPNEGVTYLATIEPTGGRHLRTVEVIVDEGATDPRDFRVPVRLVEDLSRYILAVSASIDRGVGEALDDIFALEEVEGDGLPTTDRLFELTVSGVTAKGIAEIYGRSESRIYQLLRAARRERPDMNWPAVKRGPKTTDGK